MDKEERKLRLEEIRLKKEELRLKRIGIVIQAFLTLAIVLFAYVTFAREYQDIWSGIIAVIFMLLVFYGMWSSLKPKKKK